MKNTKNNQLKASRGITLIALVITIIVLLILAGVSIAMLTGQNGILTQAQKAKEKTEQAKEDELRKLTAIEAATYLEEYEYEDPSGETITIPAQCAVSQVEGENTLEDGLVIIDKNGNEWVWIVVPKSVTASCTTDEEIKNALINYATDYREENYSDTWYDGCGLEEEEYANKYSTMLQSVKANGGFYIGKYEVGIKEDIYRDYGTDYETEHTLDETPVIQPNKYPYNWVRCSQAEELAEGLATGEKTSTLMFGIQWDLVLTYLEHKGISASDLKTNSGSWGNYSDVQFPVAEGNKYAILNQSTSELGSWNIVQKNYTKPDSETENMVLLLTKSAERNSKMNIYDLAGNLAEWTLEKRTYISTYGPCVLRGGSYNILSSIKPASGRDIRNPIATGNSIGFRPALY